MGTCVALKDALIALSNSKKKDILNQESRSVRLVKPSFSYTNVSIVSWFDPPAGHQTRKVPLAG